MARHTAKNEIFDRSNIVFTSMWGSQISYFISIYVLRIEFRVILSRRILQKQRLVTDNSLEIRRKAATSSCQPNPKEIRQKVKAVAAFSESMHYVEFFEVRLARAGGCLFSGSVPFVKSLPVSRTRRGNFSTAFSTAWLRDIHVVSRVSCRLLTAVF